MGLISSDGLTVSISNPWHSLLDGNVSSASQPALVYSDRLLEINTRLFPGVTLPTVCYLPALVNHQTEGQIDISATMSPCPPLFPQPSDSTSHSPKHLWSPLSGSLKLSFPYMVFFYKAISVVIHSDFNVQADKNFKILCSHFSQPFTISGILSCRKRFALPS